MAFSVGEGASLKPFIAGGVGGVCNLLPGHPFDTIKVRLQTMPSTAANRSLLYGGMLDCFKKTVRHEGILGLYKGMCTPLFGATPIFAVYFLGFDFGKKCFAKDLHNIRKSELFCSGMLSGVFTTSIVVPAERIKCLLQIQANSDGSTRYKGPLDVLKKLYSSGGIKNVYKGTAATLIRDVPGSGVYFLSYEWIKELLRSRTSSKNDLGLTRTVFAGGIAGVLTWVIALPPDVLKSRLQTAPDGRYSRGIRSVFAEIMAKEGISALYIGIAPVMVRAFLANGTCFLGYEISMRAMNLLVPNL